MSKTAHLVFFISLFLAGANNAFAQQQAANEDISIKEEYYRKYRKEVQSYDKKEFDALFFEFFKKQKDVSVILTKEEFYTYTIKIAIYSEKLGLLYKDQKDEAQKTKQEWFNRNYSDYLNSKK